MSNKMQSSSKELNKAKSDSLKSQRDESTSSKEIVYIQQPNSHLLTTFLVFIIALLLGIVIQQNFLASPASQKLNEQVSQKTLTETKLDIDALYKEISEKVKKELLESNQIKKDEINLEQKNDKKDTQKTDKPNKQPQDDIINEVVVEEKKDEISNEKPKKVVIDDKMVEDKAQEIKFTNGQPIVIDTNTFKVKTEETKQEKKEEPKLPPTKKPQVDKKEKKSETETSSEKKQSQTSKLSENSKEQKKQEIPKEIKNFKSKTISHIKPKKMWIPIPNSNGGHRRVPAIEIKAGKDHGSSVKVWLYEEFLSKEECENLIQAHESHLKEMLKQKPIICFSSFSTLKKNLNFLKRENIAEIVTPNDFIPGTMCLNQTFSRQLEKWGLKWSFSTAFYPGESKFSKVFGKRIEEATMLNETHGGKFQITSYPHDVGYKSHTDCVVDSDEQRDRYATFLVYLNDLGADGGGETIFPELGIDVKPREGRALTWTNMNYETGECESKSTHEAAKVKHLVKKKYIIQRWYYYKNFYALGKRMQDSDLPERPPNTPKVSCDDYDNGSCRMYDEWNPDHLLEYQKEKKLY